MTDLRSYLPNTFKLLLKAPVCVAQTSQVRININSYLMDLL